MSIDGITLTDTEVTENALRAADMHAVGEAVFELVAARSRMLWPWIHRAQREFMACLADRHAGPVGGGADIGDRCEQGVLPEVVGLPPGDLVQHVGLGPAMGGRRGKDGELELSVLPSAEAAL